MGPRPILVSIAAGMLMAAACLSPGCLGRDRWRELTAAPHSSVEQPPALRLVWLIVGCCAVGAVGWAVGGAIAGGVAVVLGALAGAGARRVLSGRLAERTENSAELAGCWELLAACLEAGLPVAGAVLATATPLRGGAGQGLRRVAGLLELGADPVDAWRTVEHRPALAPFARAAARSAGTGAALARVAHTEAARLRAALTDSAQAQAQRAAVLITGPLGLCFLPAFLALGIAPVVIGLAGKALARW
jgi:Flp pilus assembly protein TadB